MNKYITTIILTTIAFTAFAQTLAQAPQAKVIVDTLANPDQLDDVTVTATRSERKVSNVAVPVSIVNKQTIQQCGSVRLNDILGEQTGLFITNNFGAGVQMQGLDPAYTLILLDGEPIVGRTSGVLDLSRITVNNIKKIEIVKGPSSCLYGSEALAGVINIITDGAYSNNIGAAVRYGSLGTVDVNANASFSKNKFNAALQGDYYHTSGYDLSKNTPGNTQDPFHNYTLQLKAGYAFSPKTKWRISTRYFNEKQKTPAYDTKDEQGKTEHVFGNASLTDFSINNSLDQQFSANIKNALRLTISGYKSDNHQMYEYADTADNYAYNDNFKQLTSRLEDQLDWKLNEKMNLTIGAGWVFDKITSNRYSDSSDMTKNNQSGYIYAQYEWNPSADWLFIAGGRYDYNQIYQTRFSPKIAVQKKFGKMLRVNASIGAGFKAPDFRQLYLNFTNNIAGTGYTVLGNTSLMDGMKQLQDRGLIQTVMIDPASIGPLKPETSTGINLGINFTPIQMLTLNVNFFRNDIQNLINTGTIAQKTNNAFVYTYFNIDRVYTQGMETEVVIRPLKNVHISAGYQLLYTADKNAREQIEEGKVFGRDKGTVYQLKLKDYYGLFDRSRHIANLKLFYENSNGWFANIRCNYRSGWGLEDKDGNLLYNRGDGASPDCILTNISCGKSFNCGLTVQAGCDNLFDYQNAQYSPNIPGRVIYSTIKYSITYKHKTK